MLGAMPYHIGMYTNTIFTSGNPGWYKYTASVQAAGGPVNRETRLINTSVWPQYEKTVRDGTFWGGHITGAGTGVMEVLELVPATTSTEKDEDAGTSPKKPLMCC